MNATPHTPGEPPLADKADQELKLAVVHLAKFSGLFLILFLLVKTFIIEGCPVNGPSM